MNRRAQEWGDQGRAILRGDHVDPATAKAVKAHALSVAAEADAYVEPPAPIAERRRLSAQEMAERLGLSVRTLARRRHLPGYRDFVIEDGRGFQGDSERFEAFLRRR